MVKPVQRCPWICYLRRRNQPIGGGVQLFMRQGVWLFTLVLMAGCGSAPPQKSTAERAKVTGRIKVASVLVSPNFVHYVRPIYPKEARNKHIEGTVKLRAIMTKTGELRDLQVLEGDPLLANAVLEAARQWRYKPSRINGEPVETVVPIEFTFKLPDR